MIRLLYVMVISAILAYVSMWVTLTTKAQSVESAPTELAFAYTCAHSQGVHLGDCLVTLPELGLENHRISMRRERIHGVTHFIGYTEHSCTLYRLEILVEKPTYFLTVKQNDTCR